MKTIIIQAGDSLYSLAQREYDNEALWRELSYFTKKNIFDPLVAGEKLEIPDKKEVLQLANSILSDISISQIPELSLEGIKQSTGSPYSLIEWIL